MNERFYFAFGRAERIEPDHVTPEERRQIDAALEAGRVTVCPPRRFSEPAEGVARDSTWGRAAISRHRRRAQRQEKVAQLRAEGLDAARIAARLMWGVSTINRDISEIEAGE